MTHGAPTLEGTVNLPVRLFVIIVVWAVVSSAIVAQRWAIERGAPIENRLVAFQTTHSRSSAPGYPNSVSTVGPVNISSIEALRRASRESSMRVVEPTYRPVGFTLRSVSVSNSFREFAWVILAYVSGPAGFALSGQNASTEFNVRFSTSATRLLEVAGHSDTFAVTDEGVLITYHRRTSTRVFDLIMDLPDPPLSQEEALKVLVSLPSR